MKTQSCSKCEATTISDRYNTTDDVLDRACLNCGYIWQEYPADQKKTLTEEARII